MFPPSFVDANNLNIIHIHTWYLYWIIIFLACSFIANHEIAEVRPLCIAAQHTKLAAPPPKCSHRWLNTFPTQFGRETLHYNLSTPITTHYCECVIKLQRVSSATFGLWRKLGCRNTNISNETRQANGARGSSVGPHLLCASLLLTPAAGELRPPLTPTCSSLVAIVLTWRAAAPPRGRMIYCRVT